jgi:predicted ATP-grasp superfamily ATP-dependent carboligase
MDDLVELWERPAAGKYMIAGWHQWADAGDISSALPQYLIDHTNATKIGRIRPGAFYLFQVPGTHHLLRPVVKLKDGYREELGQRRNEFFYSGDETNGFLIFLGEEPHQNEQRYAKAFFDVVDALGIKRVASVGGVYGPVPYDKDREISCVYSLREMKEDLSEYAVKFSDYEGGATISTYLADRAESRGIEFFTFYAFAPSYNFSTSTTAVSPIVIDRDFKAWYDIMIRLKYMFSLDVDLSDLERRSREFIAAWDSKIDQVVETMPQLGVREYLEEIDRDFTERSFVPLSDVWEEALNHLFDEEDL